MVQMDLDWSVICIVLIDVALVITWSISGRYRNVLHHIGYQRYPSKVCVDNDNLVSLYMSPYFSHGKLAILRLVVGLYCLCVLVYGAVDSKSNGYSIFEYLSVWCWIGITSYFLFSSVFVIVAELFDNIEWIKQPKTMNDVREYSKSWYFHQLIWILHEINLCFAIVVFIAVWCGVYWDTNMSTDFRNQVMLSFYFLNMNVVSVALVYADLFLSITPVVFDNVVFGLALQIIYILFTWLYYYTTNDWVYFFLKTTDFAYVVFYALFIGVALGASFLASRLAQWRDSVLEKRKEYYLFSRKMRLAPISDDNTNKSKTKSKIKKKKKNKDNSNKNDEKNKNKSNITDENNDSSVNEGTDADDETDLEGGDTESYTASVGGGGDIAGNVAANIIPNDETKPLL